MNYFKLGLCSVTFRLIMITTLIFAIVYAPIAIVSEMNFSRSTTKAPKQRAEVPKKAPVEYQSIFSKPDDQKDGSK